MTVIALCDGASLAGSAPQHLQPSLNDVERRSQFVRQRREKPVFGSVRFFRLGARVFGLFEELETARVRRELTRHERQEPKFMDRVFFGVASHMQNSDDRVNGDERDRKRP